MQTLEIDAATHRICPSCDEVRPVESFGGSHPDECLRCHCLGVSIDAHRAMPSRELDSKPLSQSWVAKKRDQLRNANAWERGVKIARRNRDGSVMPYLDETGQPVPVKKYAENRSRYEDAARRVQADPLSLVRDEGSK